MDDSVLVRVLIHDLLKEKGYKNLVMASSAREAIAYIHQNINKKHITKNQQIDLILMDGIMPDIEGVQACKMVRDIDGMQDVPIIMVTGKTDIATLEAAFEAGANDYITKPFNTLELLARVRAALHLKYEIDKRKARERELEEVNKLLQELSSIDGLTGVANRRRFDEALLTELKRAVRKKTQLSVVMIDIDFFKEYNDTYGHQQGDECLKEIANVLKEVGKRPGDVVARYGGEEFIIILPDTDVLGAENIASIARQKVEEKEIPHSKSKVSSYVTISIGVATTKNHSYTKEKILSEVDKALYHAKRNGRNRVSVYE
ncbi:diguanylate cyclase [Desulfuribacillus stibiiarsenatis]|uniref:diguanylate cyclase n=1 Tax=Desulfuribacillus stibiiarsenatis TaxID=1390249 RepID=UPI001C4079E6|nr:diguanylate cyclase [Desulfuribacillus stibiiarsenatis]